MEESLEFIPCHKIATLDLQYYKFWYLINLYCLQPRAIIVLSWLLAMLDDLFRAIIISFGILKFRPYLQETLLMPSFKLFFLTNVSQVLKFKENLHFNKKITLNHRK